MDEGEITDDASPNPNRNCDLTQPTIYTPHSTLHTPHSALCTPHSALHTPHSTLHTLHSGLQEEDQLIIECIEAGITKWSEIAERISGRIGKQVSIKQIVLTMWGCMTDSNVLPT